jgi:hypothetical protein
MISTTYLTVKADYDPTELLTRMLALERMEEISQGTSLKPRHTIHRLARAWDAEREELKKAFLKRVK